MSPVIGSPNTSALSSQSAGSVRALAAALLVVTSGVLPLFLTGALAVQMRGTLHFGAARFGMAVAAFYAAATLSSAAGGRAAEKIGAGKVMRASALISLVSLAEMALGARSFPLLIAGLVLGGISNGIGQPATNLFLAQAVPKARHGVAFGIKQSAIPVATLLGGLAVPAIALTLGWRYAFAIACILPALGALVTPSNNPHFSSDSSTISDLNLAVLPLLVLAVGGGLGSAAGNALGTFLVQSTVASGIRPGTAGLLAALGSAAGLISRLGSGIAADRRGGGHLNTVAVMLALGAAGFAALGLGKGELLIPAISLSFAAGWGWNGLFNLAVVKSHAEAAGSATGITQTGVLIGGAAGPVLFGIIAYNISYSAAWATTAATALVAGGVVFAGGIMLRRRNELRQTNS